MSNITGTVRAALATPTTATIYNVSVPLAATEVSQALPSNTQRIFIKCRGTAKIQYAFIATQSGSNFITIPRGAIRDIDLISFTGTIYLQTSEASQTVEIEVWA